MITISVTEDICKCPICYDPFNSSACRPKVLACGHTLCKRCLSDIRHRATPSEREYRFPRGTACPVCREPVSYADVPTNYTVLALVNECQHNSQQTATSATRLSESTGDDEVRIIFSQELQLQEHIGAGPTSDVYKAVWRGCQVAVKLFRTDKLGTSLNAFSTSAPANASPASSLPDIYSAQQFESDPVLKALVGGVKQMLAFSQHSTYCVSVLGCSVKSGRPCIVMMWMPGGHLKVPEGGFNLATALQLGSSIAKALADVHELGVAVGNLQPSNILINRQGDPMLADFGISRHVTSALARHGAGTQPLYMAPEQQPQQSHLLPLQKADICAWGCLMVELITGRPSADNRLINQGFTPPLQALLLQKALELPYGLIVLFQSCIEAQATARPSAEHLVSTLKTYAPLCSWACVQDQGTIQK